jgi:streptomycin 6-kinase
MRINGYHDAGHASVLAIATTSDGGAVMLKAWFDPSRYRSETKALSVWRDGPVPRLIHTSDDLRIAALALVAEQPGGCPQPAGDEERVAKALRHLHAIDGHDAVGIARPLGEYLACEVLPRVRQRDHQFGSTLQDACRSAGWEAIATMVPSGRRDVLLHADLYQENIAFTSAGRPVFLDPLPMVGDPVFDWAFWTVYYDLTRDPLSRLLLASANAGIAAAELLPWCLTLCFDGLLYYYETADLRAGRMAEIMTSLADAGAASW